nr:protein ACCELERATED CELL DEATH 6-like [Oryza sativa Japonica Group]
MLATVPQEGEGGASPFYLAFSLGKLDIARHLLDKTNGQLSYSGLDGQNVLHAAISRGQALPVLLEWLKDVTVDVQQGDRAIRVPLVSHLAQQRDHQTGSTPLHLAASLEGWPYVGILSKWFPDVWPRPKSAVALLLEANTCAAYQPDAEGLYPIHVAALADSLDVVRTMLQKCPDCATLRDAKGRTFLHSAVEAEGYRVVEYVCRRMPKEFSSVLNMQDNNGDTALHRAVHLGNLPVFNCLTRNPHVHLNIPNKYELTPLDLSWITVPSSFYYDSNPRGLIQLSLQFVGAPCGASRPDLLSQKHIPKIDNGKVSAHLTNASQMLGIVSVLVATVTFASAFTLPGGYQTGSDNAAGTPLLAGSYAFDAFILSDTLAFICSCMATFSLIFAGVPAMDISIRCRYFEISALLLRSSGRSFVVAFALGLYLVLAPVAHTIATAVCVIIFVSSLYGNSEAWQILRVADMARARLGTRMHVAWTLGLTFYNVFVNLFLNFWSFIIIFGLPAVIRKVHARE